LSIGSGRLALQQGAHNWLTLLEQGDGSVQQQEHIYTQTLPGTYWRLAFWSAERPVTSMVWLALLLLVVIVGLLCWQLVKRFGHARNTLQTQTNDRPKTVEYVEGDVNIEPTPMPVPVVQALTPPKASKTEAVDRVRPVAIKPVIFKTYDIRGIVGTQLSDPV